MSQRASTPTTASARPQARLLAGLPILEAPRAEIDRLTDGAVHQGLALVVPPYAYASVADLIDPEIPGVPLVVALDGVTDPRNVGAVVRSVAAFGEHGVLVPERRSAGMTAAAWKVSAGAAARIPVAKATNLTRALQDLQKAGFFVLGLDMDGDVSLPELGLVDTPWSSSSGPRARACPALSLRPATRSSPSRCPPPWSRSTRASPRVWRSTRWPADGSVDDAERASSGPGTKSPG